MAKYVALALDVRRMPCQNGRHHIHQARLQPTSPAQQPIAGTIAGAYTDKLAQMVLAGDEFVAYDDDNPHVLLPVEFVPCACGQGWIVTPEDRVKEVPLPF